ncbi:MAG: hypothetical protein WA061_04145 [Microgenomates group bacterium]
MLAHDVFYKKLGSKNTRYFLGISLCIVFIAANVFASQRYNSHMYGYMDGKSEDQLTYIKHIWGSPLFDLEIKALKEEGETALLERWEKIQQQNNKRISMMEAVVQSHPYSPELYYNLFLLYSENGNTTKAHEYLQKAKEIDPSI